MMHFPSVDRPHDTALKLPSKQKQQGMPGKQHLQGVASLAALEQELCYFTQVRCNQPSFPGEERQESKLQEQREGARVGLAVEASVAKQGVQALAAIQLVKAESFKQEKHA